ncbi:MAG: hypothetical protein AAGG44_06070 [Planctomycetota bacterium]
MMNRMLTALVTTSLALSCLPTEAQLPNAPQAVNQQAGETALPSKNADLVQAAATLKAGSDDALDPLQSTNQTTVASKLTSPALNMGPGLPGATGAFFLLDGLGASMTADARIDLAVIESRLRFLEAKAQVEALEKFQDDFQLVERKAAGFALRKAELVLEERKISLRRTQRLVNQAKDRAERRAIEERLELDRLSVRDAEITKDEAEFAVEQAGREFDIRTREARLMMESADRWRQLILKEFVMKPGAK